MAKLKIKLITHNGKWTNIEFTDGQKAGADNEKEPKFKELKEGQEVDLEIKHWKDDKYFANFPKAAGSGSKFPPRDVAWEKRSASLGHAIDAIKLTGKEVKTPNILALAEEFHSYINQK